MQTNILFLLCITMVCVCGCIRNKPFYNKSAQTWQETSPSENNISHTVFLIGDAGKPSLEEPEPVLQLLKKNLEESQEKSTVVYLGDNIYPKGMPEKAREPERKEAERHLTEQLKILENYLGKIIFIPGNHDWAQGRKTGWKYVNQQEEFVEEYLNKGNVFLPDNGCPGPVEILLEDDLVLIVLDTQWWLHNWDKPGEEFDCSAKSDSDFMLQLNDAVKRHADKKIIVAGHHPLWSNGVHGGHFPPIEHLFPFARKKAFIPLPVLGSIYVGYRKFIGNIQDIPNVRYQQLRKNLLQIFEGHPNLIYAAGHDHNLQYHQKNKLHHVVSGAGCKESYIARKKKAHFAYEHKGFARLDFHKNGEVWLSFWIPEGAGESGKEVYRTLLTKQTSKQTKATKEERILDYSDSTKKMAVSKEYKKAKGFKRWLFGNNYRQEWAEEVVFPYFDMGKEHGGLEVVQRGGGQATNSLRVQAKDGKQYVLRSVDKQGDKALGDELRGTIVADIVQDQTSAAYPYGALVVPLLADAAGIHHTNPQYVYLPKDPLLEKYQNTFGGAIYLYEERPEKNQKGLEGFGRADNILSTAKTIKKITKDNDDLIDQKSVLRHRLFDMWIGDWDRHDDQWRWAVFNNKENNLKYYQPIPRDRDQTFFLSDGWVIDVATHKWGIPKFQGFHEKMRDINGFNFNGRYFDRYFLTQPSLEDWLAMADTLQRRVTDEVIEKAMQEIPEKVRGYHGKEIIAKLKKRREDLKVYARKYYLFLAKNVNVLGTNKHELFEVERLNEEETKVTVYKVKKEEREKKHILYERTFKRSETDEIHLYGLGGEDEFVITGNVPKGIRIRVIGGEEKDKILDSSVVKTGRKKTVVYDTPENTILEGGKETKNRLSKDVKVNFYDRKAFKYDYLGPLAYFGFNADDGLFVGGGVNIRKQGFRKDPYKSRHLIKANYAIATKSYSILYKGEWKEALGKLDIVLDVDARVPNYVQNFFGLSNESNNFSGEKGLTFNRVRYEQWFLQTQLRKQWSGERYSISLGGYAQRVKVEQSQNRFINDFEQNGLDSTNTLDISKYFVGAVWRYSADTRDDLLIPSKGIRFNLESSIAKGLDSDTDDINYTQVKGDFSFYLGFGSAATLAARVGGAHNWGDFEFYQANSLGGAANLRGHRKFRFSGRSNFFQNTELRLNLFKLRSFLFNGQFGVLGIHDVGRVWADGEQSIKWHQGYGGGIWFTPAQAVVLSTTYTASDDDNLLFIRFGFLF